MNRDNKMMKFRNLYIGTADALLPNPDIDLEKWAVIACDQHTSDEKYWEKVKENVGDAPSTLNIIYPEVYLKNDDEDTRKEKIKEISKKNLEYFESLYEEVTEKRSDGFIYVKRQTSTGTRRGILMCLDLTQVGEDKLFRPSERVVEDRLKVRIDIRKEANMETPHIIMFANDKDNLLFEKENEYEQIKLYDFNLMENGGHIEGYDLKGEKAYYVADAFAELSKVDGPVLIAADGNHGLMAAKKYYDELEENFGERFLKDHPLRYVLVEVVNIHDDAIKIYPIHRVLFNANKETVLKLVDSISGASFVENGGQIKVKGKDFEGGINIGEDYLKELETAIEALGLEVDYLHSEGEALDLAKEGNVALILPEIDKDMVFEYVKKHGLMPKKSFSIGQEQDKKYYVETRRIMM